MVGKATMWQTVFRWVALVGFGAVVLSIVPGMKAATLAGTIDLGTLVYGTNINAAILNLADPSDPQLVQGPNSTVLDMTLDSGNTVAQELTVLGYSQDNGVLNYNFPFALGASGSYSQMARRHSARLI